jgi:hypothetical protein
MLRQAHERPAFEDSLASESRVVPPQVEATSIPAPAVVPSTATPSPAVGSEATSTAVVTSAPTVTPPPMPASTGTHELRITAKEEAWFALALDDQSAKQYLLRAEESRTWQAERFSLTVGNAGGVVLFLDGQELPSVGRPGQVVRNLRLPSAAPPSPSPRPTE